MASPSDGEVLELRRRLMRMMDRELERLEAQDPAEREPGRLCLLMGVFESLKRISAALIRPRPA